MKCERNNFKKVIQSAEKGKMENPAWMLVQSEEIPLVRPAAWQEVQNWGITAKMLHNGKELTEASSEEFNIRSKTCFIDAPKREGKSHTKNPTSNLNSARNNYYILVPCMMKRINLLTIGEEWGSNENSGFKNLSSARWNTYTSPRCRMECLKLRNCFEIAPKEARRRTNGKSYVWFVFRIPSRMLNRLKNDFKNALQKLKGAVKRKIWLHDCFNKKKYLPSLRLLAW